MSGEVLRLLQLEWTRGDQERKIRFEEASRERKIRFEEASRERRFKYEKKNEERKIKNEERKIRFEEAMRERRVRLEERRRKLSSCSSVYSSDNVNGNVQNDAVSNVPQISSRMQSSSEINDYSWRSNTSSQEQSQITGQTYESGMNHNFNFGRKGFVDRSSQCLFCRYPKPNHSPENCFKNPNNNHLRSANVRHVTIDFPVPMQTFDDRKFICDIEGLYNRNIEQGDQYSEVKSSNDSVCNF